MVDDGHVAFVVARSGSSSEGDGIGACRFAAASSAATVGCVTRRSAALRLFIEAAKELAVRAVK